MKLFVIPQGSVVKILPPGRELYGEHLKVCHLDREVVFELEEVAIDPIGSVAPLNGPTVGAEWARKGWYGFRRAEAVVPGERKAPKEWLMLVPGTKVAVV